MDGRAWRAFVDLKRVFSQSLISVRQFVDCEAALEISSPRHFLCVFIIKAILYISFEKNEMKYFKTKKKAFSFKETAENEGLLFILALDNHITIAYLLPCLECLLGKHGSPLANIL